MVSFIDVEHLAKERNKLHICCCMLFNAILGGSPQVTPRVTNGFKNLQGIVKVVVQKDI